MALQPPAAGMHGHRSVATFALCAPAAVVAQQHWRVATTVLEHQHLATGRQRIADRIEQFNGQSGLQRPLAHVEHAHHRRLRVAGALVQAQVRVASAARVVQRFQRWRGAAQQHRHGQRLAAEQREIACVVADPVLLLVTGIVFLVDHDQPASGND